jgi:hypothetical protein
MLIANSKAAAIDRDANAGQPYRPHNGNFTTYRTLSGISYGVGAAALLAGGWMVWTSADRSEQAALASPAPLVPTFQADRVSLTVSGTF